MKPWKRAWHGTKEDAKLYKIWSANTVWMAFFPFRSHTGRGGFIPHIPHILPFICNMVWLAGCPCYCYIEDEDRVDCWSNIQFFFLLFAVLCLTCIFGRLLRKLVHYSTWFWEVFYFYFLLLHLARPLCAQIPAWWAHSGRRSQFFFHSSIQFNLCCFFFLLLFLLLHGFSVVVVAVCCSSIYLYDALIGFTYHLCASANAKATRSQVN